MKKAYKKPLYEAEMIEDINLWISTNLVSTLNETEFGCTAGKDNFYIDDFGNVYGCSMMATYTELKAGNLKEEPLYEIWNESTVFKKLREINLQDVLGNCKNCKLLLTCKAGCRACAFSFHNDLMSSDERCPICKKELILNDDKS
ncbi:SPASM domain-containing protein [Calorimonas adulescens]|uniref:SPASM domain-containing protein n=1 Tax=Calorimonas adulescens TaxID=2606906 RepID=A0A5D8QB84_9THEO|nr:SPASM domain-containing protein [Calorimonas adulescens]MDI6600425.1 SPASM domain-containing protein [Thermoanaerobacteraceae bacterium]TZE81399.1 SPASM domain-containing protein [Calorimonas adulescens]